MGLGRTFQTPRFLSRSTVAENMKLGTDLADQMGFFKSFLGKKGNNFLDEVGQYLEIADLKVNWKDDISSASSSGWRLSGRCCLIPKSCWWMSPPPA